LFLLADKFLQHISAVCQGSAHADRLRLGLDKSMAEMCYNRMPCQQSQPNFSLCKERRTFNYV
ncbi:hypothetical protein VSQ48_24935, partial [Candidatus Ventrimonas sp. KK005]